MKSNNAVLDKSYKFSLRIIKLYKYLCEEKKEFVLSKQILRSGTSIGANIEEAIGGFSPKDFLYKMTISYKEARETHYWLRLLHDSHYIEGSAFNSILEDCEEILKLLTTIIKSTKAKEE